MPTNSRTFGIHAGDLVNTSDGAHFVIWKRVLSAHYSAFFPCRRVASSSDLLRSRRRDGWVGPSRAASRLVQPAPHKLAKTKLFAQSPKGPSRHCRGGRGTVGLLHLFSNIGAPASGSPGAYLCWM